jgi:sterol desaturase/sphingolipid hydroxylase (fatty acid hydroxylase superfamily)
MEWFQALVFKVVSPVLSLVIPANRFYWLYIATAIALALAINYTRSRTSARGRWRDAVAASFPGKVFLHPSAIVDYKYIVINQLLQVLVFGWFLLTVVTMTGWTTALLQAAFDAEGVGLAPDTGARVLVTVFTLLAVDFGLFFAHYLQHRIPLLWEFHKVHHSAQVLTPLTVLRMHPVDIMLNSLVTSALLGLCSGVFLYLYAGSVAVYTVLGSNVVVFVFFFGGYHLRHSHVWVLFPNPIRRFISSPALHLIHHSTDPKHYDKNMARIFTFWDWLFGTLYIPDGYEEIEFGMGGDEHLEFDSVWQLYVLPFKNIARRRLPSKATAR